jgi:aconitate hydratase
MLALTASPSQLAEALHTGSIWVRPARSIQILLSGKVRPFVCVRDVALELIRRGLGEIVRRIDGEYQAPVVLEFAGPSARLLSVPDRAVLCGLAPQVGAAAALFISDEKTEVYLRDQRRSKAHRALVPDAGAPCDEVVTVDLGAVDPLIMDEEGAVRPVRELADRPVHQVILGGDSGASLRDLLAAAALLKSKRVPARLDLLVAPPSRQALEVLAHSGALVDLIATGARLIEPDVRVVTGELYPPPQGGTSLRTFDPEPSKGQSRPYLVASAETLAYAVAYGHIGDPRSFKRPVRVTVPRSLPTDDVLIVRKGRGKPKTGDTNGKKGFSEPPSPDRWKEHTKLPVVTERMRLDEPSALVFDSLEDVRWAERHASSDSAIKAVIAPHIPAATVSVLSGLGVLALRADEADLRALSAASSVALPSPGEWHNGGIRVVAGDAKFTLTWLAVGAERRWAESGAYGANGASK